MPFFAQEEERRFPKILSIQIEFLCPVCQRRLSVEEGIGSQAECGWCHSEISVPQLSTTPGAKTGKSLASLSPLLTQDELEFLTSRSS